MIEQPMTETQNRDLIRARRRARLVGLILPLLLTGIAVLLVASWLPRLPDPVVIQWGPEGPGGFGPAWTYLALSAGLGVGIPLLMWTILAAAGRGGAMPVWSSFQRLMASVSLGVVAFMQTLVVGLAAVQLDLADARDAPTSSGAMVAAFAVWIMCSVLAWLLQPKVTILPDRVGASAPLDLAETEIAVWIGEARPSKVFLSVVGAAIALTGGLSIGLLLTGVPAWIAPGIVCLAMMILLATLSWFWVRADAAGLEVRSIVGWPVFRVPASEVASVEATRINALAEFGGWGVRWSPGRFGIVIRNGEGIVATRKDGRIFAVTVDDAELGAAVLMASAKRAGGAE